MGMLIQDAEPRNGLVNMIWEKGARGEIPRRFTVKELNKLPNTALEYILSTVEEAEKQARTKKKK